MSRMATKFNYDVAFSFAGEDRKYVGKVAEILHQIGVRIFYDDYERVDLWGKDLYSHLDEVYRKKSKYCWFSFLNFTSGNSGQTTNGKAHKPELSSPALNIFCRRALMTPKYRA